MEVFVSPMRDADRPVLGGAHDSDGWQVDTPWHVHDMHQLLYAFEDAVDVEGMRARYRVPQQFAAWIPAGAVHRTRIQRVASASVFLASHLVHAAGDHPRVIQAPALLREMIRHARCWPLSGEETEESRAYFRCMAVLSCHWISDEVSFVLPSVEDPKTLEAIELTRQRLATATIGQVARAVGMSERSLRRRFSQESGLSWGEYRRRLQLIQATDLLAQSDRAIGLIAADVGYQSQAAFAAAFRKFVGLSPREYRSSLR